VLGSSNGYEVPIDGSASVVSLGFSGDGDRLVTAADDTVVVWDAANGQQIGPLITPATTKGETPRVTDLAFDRKGGHLAASTGDGRVFVWDAAEKSAAPSAVLRVHTDAAVRVAFAADGRQLLTASLDDTVCVWDIGPPQNPQDGSFAALREFGQGIVSRLFTAEQLAAIVREQ
jgi:WD40 repeat protein